VGLGAISPRFPAAIDERLVFAVDIDGLEADFRSVGVLAAGIDPWRDCGVPSMVANGALYALVDDLNVGSLRFSTPALEPGRLVAREDALPETEPSELWLEPGREALLLGRARSWSKKDEDFLLRAGDDGMFAKVSMVRSESEGRGLNERGLAVSDSTSFSPKLDTGPLFPSPTASSP